MFQSYGRKSSPACVIVAVAAAAMLGIPELGAAQAQQADPAQQQTPPAAAAPAAQETVASADVTDTELEQFAKSMEEVVEIQQEVEKEVAEVQDSAEVQRLKTEANQKMAEAIQENGMQVERFNLIARSINQDPMLKQRLQEKMKELQQPA